MPRFLALDYFAIAQQDARAALSRLLLSVPVHLEHVETYAHQGIVPSSLYRTPWIKSTVFTIAEDSIEEQVAALAASYQEGKVESFENNMVYCAEAECEIVPSSNPCSQESIDAEVLHKLGVLNSKDNGKEYFEKDVAKDDHADMFLEELCGDILHASTPDIGKLLSRLKPMSMTDPFVDEDGKPIQEDKFLGPYRKLVEENDAGKLYEGRCSLDHAELVLKEKLPSKEEQEKFIEINITEETECMELKTDVQQLLVDAKEEILDGVLKDDMTSLISKEPYKLHVVVEPLDDKDAGITESVDFLQMNDVSTEFKESEAMLESPVLEKVADDCILMTPWTKESSLNTSDQPDIKSDILSQKSKSSVEQELWIQGKYFDDVLALRLKEPDCSMLVAVCIAPGDIMKELNVKSTLFDTKNLDLELQWDPFQKKGQPLELESLKPIPACTNSPENDVFEEPIQKQPVFAYVDGEEKKIACSGVLPTLYHPQEILASKYSNVKPHEITEQPIKKNPERAAQTPRKVGHSPISVCTPAQFDDISIFMSMRSAKKRENARFSKAKIMERPSANILDKSRDTTKQTSSLTIVKDLNKDKKIEDEKKNEEPVCSLPAGSPPKSLVRSTPDLDCTIAPSSPCTPSHLKRSSMRKCNIVSAALGTLHQDMLVKLEQLSQKHICHLATRRLLPSSQDFFSLTPDVTRFILKQHEKKRGSDDDFSAVVMLHVLACCADMVTHCCIQSAATQLESMKEKYAGHGTFREVEGIFQDIQQQTQEKLSHPAMLKLCEHLSHWLVKKKLKSPGHDPKILIMMKQGISGLCEAIADVVSSVVSTEVFKPGSSQLTPQDICAQLDNHTCLVIPAPLIDLAFPWSQFSMVVQYDYREGQDKWKDICCRQNIRFLGVQIQTPKLQFNTAVGKSPTVLVSGSQKVSSNIPVQSQRCTPSSKTSQSVGGNPNRSPRVSNFQSPQMMQYHENMSPRVLSASTPSKKVIPCTLIASNHVVELSALLQELESKYKIFISTRTSSSFDGPDICINQSTCVMLVSLSGGVPGNKLVNNTVTRLGRLLLGFSMVWVLLHGNLHSARPSSSDYVFSGNAVSVVGKIQAVVANFSKMLEPAKAKVLVCGTAAGTASIIRQIVDVSKPFNSDMPEPSDHELLLGRLPCLNTINIHHVLQKVPLTTLAMMSVQQLKHYFPQIPQAQLEVLWNVVNVNQGVGFDKIGDHMPDTVQTDACVEPVGRQDHNEGLVQYSPETFSPGKQCELPDLKLSQPNEFAKAEMEGRQLNSFMEEEDIESPFELGNDAPFQQRDRWNEAKYAISRQHQAIEQHSRFVPMSPVIVQRHMEKHRGRQSYSLTPTNMHPNYEATQNSGHKPWSTGSHQIQSSTRSKMLSPKGNDQPPCLAPVTPTVRKQQLVQLTASPPMDLSSDESESEQLSTIAKKLAEKSARWRNTKNEDHATQGRQRLHHSAPHNPYKAKEIFNTDEHFVQPFQGRYGRNPERRHEHMQERTQHEQWGMRAPDPSYNEQQSAPSENFLDTMHNEERGIYNPERYSEQYSSNKIPTRDIDGYSKHSSSRKRKLTYIPVPGFKSGQTKLAFL